MHNRYAIVMFAYNEEKNIETSIKSVFDNIDERLNRVLVIANGCKDNTVGVVKSLQDRYPKLEVFNIELGDKCNAWNTYMHELAGDEDVHFFVDADVEYTPRVFPQLFDTLLNSPKANAVAGLPLTGRNVEFYRNLVINNSCLFGNCHGLKNEFVRMIKEKRFKLPVGLSWIDSAITKAVNSDIEKQSIGYPGRVVYKEGCGYHFESLSPFRLNDIKLYLNRIARYEVGKLQESYLEKLEFSEWPDNLDEINQNILERINRGNIKPKFYVKKRMLKRLGRKLSP